MSIPKDERWMQVEWNSGGRSVVNARYLLKSLPTGEELKIGTVVTIGKQESGAPLTATVLASARDRKSLERTPTPEVKEASRPPSAGTSAKKEQEQPVADQEQGDYSPSASDWEPSGESSSEESEEEEESPNTKKVKQDRSNVRQYSNKTSRKVPTPSHRANAVIPNNMQQLALQNRLKNNKRTLNDSRKSEKTLPDSTKKNKQNDFEQNTQELVNGMKELFDELFKIMREVKPSFSLNDITEPKPDSIETDLEIIKNATREQDNSECMKTEVNDTQEEARSDCEYSDRSDDNVLITNKYNNALPKKSDKATTEWVPIGSGTTLIHREKYRKVNWKSYTIATRTLLLAAFSRRTLATHSLTGKKSPAFTNKPAKMCLDPKIVADIVIEITDKFNVKDNLVRSIITTKCADECKMYKMKHKNQSQAQKKGKNQENIPPSTSNTNN